MKLYPKLVIAAFLFSQSTILAISYKVKSVTNDPGSSCLSIFNTNPESSNGKFLAYCYYPQIVEGGHQGPCVVAEVRIRNLRTNTEKLLTKAIVTNHNGAHAVWVNKSSIAVETILQREFELYDVQSGKSLFGKIAGEVPHQSYSKKTFFSRCNNRAKEIDNKHDVFNQEEEGIWVLNLKSGKINLLITKDAIVNAFKNQNKTVTSNNVHLLHIEPNFSNTIISFDFRHTPLGAKDRIELHGLFFCKTKKVKWIPVRPMHCVWYNNNFLMGVDTFDSLKSIWKYNFDGKKVEQLAGSACHIGASPDRSLYAGEKGYYGPDKDGKTRLCLYRKGNVTQFEVIDEWTNNKITWKWVAHVNPSFSADGKRLYYVRALENDKFEAMCVTIK